MAGVPRGIGVGGFATSLTAARDVRAGRRRGEMLLENPGGSHKKFRAWWRSGLHGGKGKHFPGHRYQEGRAQHAPHPPLPPGQGPGSGNEHEAQGRGNASGGREPSGIRRRTPFISQGGVRREIGNPTARARAADTSSRAASRCRGMLPGPGASSAACGPEGQAVREDQANCPPNRRICPRSCRVPATAGLCTAALWFSI